MKKLFAIILALAMVSTLAACGQEAEDKDRWVITQQRNEHYLDGEVSYTFQTDYTCDENGFLALRIMTENGEETSRTTYKRDTYGNTIQEITENAGTTTVEDHELTLDEQNRVIKDIVSIEGEPRSITEYGYDAQDRLIRLDITRLLAGTTEGMEDIFSSTRIIYDSRGNTVRNEVIWNDDSPIVVESEFDSQDRIIRDTTYDAKNPEAIDRYTEFSYDDTGLVRTAVSYDANGTELSRTVDTFDEHGNRIRSESYIEGSLTSRITYTYQKITAPAA